MKNILVQLIGIAEKGLTLITDFQGLLTFLVLTAFFGFWSCFCLTYEPQHDKTNNMAVRPAKTQISLGIRPVWSESSLSAWRNLEPLAIHWAHSEDSDQTGRMPRLLWVFAGRTVTCWFCHVAAHIFSVSVLHQKFLQWLNKNSMSQNNLQGKLTKPLNVDFKQD